MNGKKKIKATKQKEKKNKSKDNFKIYKFYWTYSWNSALNSVGDRLLILFQRQCN